MKQCHDVMNEFHLWHQTNPVLFQYWKERSWVCQPKCHRGAFWQTRRGGSEGRRSCCGHLWQPPPRPPPPLPPLPLPPVQDAWDREHVGAAGFLLIQNQWNQNPCRGQSMAFGFLFDASCLNFFITLYKGRKKKKTEKSFLQKNAYSEDLTHWWMRAEDVKLPLICHCMILKRTCCGGILLTQAFVIVFATGINVHCFSWINLGRNFVESS